MSVAPETFRVKSEQELLALEADLKSKLGVALLLYRGQTDLFKEVRSGRNRPDHRVPPEIENGWAALTRRMLDRLGHADVHPTKPKLRGILQHYGLSTNFVDLTSSITVAAWFAIHERKHETAFAEALRMFPQEWYEPAKNGSGYILVLGFSSKALRQLQRKGRLIDLSELPESIVRPRRQHGWVMFDHPPLMPTPNEFWLGTIEIVRSGWPESSLSFHSLFPPPAEDPAYRALLNTPFAQIPAAYVDHDPSEEEEMNKLRNRIGPLTEEEYSSLKMMDEFCFGMRVLGIPEHARPGSAIVNHKWNDRTLYEPHPVRLWNLWNFALSQKQPSLRGNISQCVKIILSPDVCGFLHSRHYRTNLAWPSLGSDDLFFSFSQVEADIIFELAPPFKGVWLHRQDDAIVETPTSSEGDKLIMHGGHAYLFVDGRLRREYMDGACSCGRPDAHDRRVRAMLSLSRAIQEMDVVLVPHPFGIERCFIAF